ncbi:MAG: SGNH/GDSL hydrolase family protein [Proteobacteria bacterium]|nr:SGNH/GDSL hydrolase family protein [Pseudomonadota bacterium]
MKRVLGILILCSLMFLSGPALAEVMGPVAPPQFDNLLVFGDSLSDSGNVFTFAQGQAPDPQMYWQGRWSNGPVWSENLAGLMGLDDDLLLSQLMVGAVAEPTFGSLFLNSSFGGAETGTGAELPVVDFLDQVADWMDAGTMVPANSLVTVWIGANDFLGATITTEQEMAAVIGAAITNIVTGLTQLTDVLGATDIALFDLPDLGATPLNNGTPEGRAQGRALSQAFNANLIPAVQAFDAAHPNVTIYYISAFGMFDDALETPGKYGFTNATDAALLSGKTFDTADGYIFWDSIHPTAQTHELMAARVYGDIFIGAANASYLMTNTGLTLGIVPVTGDIVNVEFMNPADTAEAGRPISMDYGLLDVDLTLAAGTTAVFQVVLPQALPADYSFYKYINGQWVDFVEVSRSTGGLQGAQISVDRKTVTITIEDNGAYDADPDLGEVSDPVGSGQPRPAEYESDSSCFINTLR